MIDLRAARHDPDGFRSALARKGGADEFDQLLAADERWRAATGRQEQVRAEQKRLGRPQSQVEAPRERLGGGYVRCPDLRALSRQRRPDIECGERDARIVRRDIADSNMPGDDRGKFG